MKFNSRLFISICGFIAIALYFINTLTSNEEVTRNYVSNSDYRLFQRLFENLGYKIKRHDSETLPQDGEVVVFFDYDTGDRQMLKELTAWASRGGTLILAHIVFHAGDTVSIIAYSDRIIDYLPPVKGKAGINLITKFITRLQPEFVESNYERVFTYIERKLKKRSLLFFLTDIIDDINVELYKKRVLSLSKKHSVLFILIRDKLLTKHCEQKIKNNTDFYLTSASREMFLHRKKATENMRAHRMDVLDILPEELTGPLVNRYLQIKSRNRM